MLLSVIIPTCNRNDLLGKCLDLLTLGVQTIDPYWYEVIITDDSKLNNAKNLIEEKFKWAKWIEGPKRGPAANRNNGAKYASGEWYIFLDDDCLPEKNWFNTYMGAIQSYDNILVFEGSTIPERPKQRFDEEAPINLTGNKLWSCNFAIKKDLFEKLEGFDELFPFAAMEDVDFYSRVLKYTPIKFVPQALVIHPWRKIKPFKSFRKHLKSHIYYANKHNLRGTLNFRWMRFKIFLGSIVFSIKELYKYSFKGWPAYLEKCLFNFFLIFI